MVKTKLVRVLGLAAIGGWIVYRWSSDQTVVLPAAVEGDRETFTSPDTGRISYYVDRQGSGRPLVLIHSINAAPSAFEVKPLFDHYRVQRPVYALDLPGFGFSDRVDRVYSPAFFADAIATFLREQVGEAADVVALSLSSEFVARAATDQPDLFHSLTFISPTGFNKVDISLPGDTIYGVVSVPLWSQPLFDLLVSRPSIRYYSGQSFVNETPQAFLDYAYATSHQPGARYVPLYFLSGQLFTPKARESLYERVETPTLVIYDRDPNIDFDRLPDLLEKNNRWQAVKITPSLGLPHWEKLEETIEVLETFWGSL